MSDVKYFKSASSGLEGDFLITENGIFYTDQMPPDSADNVAVIAAYDSNGGAVTSISVGTVLIECSPILGQWHSVSSGDSPILMSEVIGEASYSMPVFSGPVTRARITIAGVDFVADGISYIKAFIWRK